MKRYRVLIAWRLWSEINAIPHAVKREIYRKFDQLEESPDAISEFQSLDDTGRTLDCFIAGQLAVFYWVDFADRHVKVLDIRPADHGAQ
ncbi:MAG: hypothetical protein ABI680_16295 [Chthoniobacteraceae bacterium]